MNLLLLRPPYEDECSYGLLPTHCPSGLTYRLTPEQTKHVLLVLKKKDGEALKVGVVGLGTMSAVLNVIDGVVSVRLPNHWRESIQECNPPKVHLILALPRPKALLRIIENAVSLGIERLDLINSWRVEKAYFQSPKLAKPELNKAVTLGLEQSKQVHPPTIGIHRGFRQYLEDRYPIISRELSMRKEHRFLMHPMGSSFKTIDKLPSSSSVSIAIGPEGGFIESEVKSFEATHFHAMKLFEPIVKTEVAVTAALSQLHLLRQ